MSQEEPELASIGHVAENPRAYRKHLRARLAEAEAALLTSLLGLDAAQLASPALSGHRSPLHILSEHTEADRLATLALEPLLGDGETRTTRLPPANNCDAHQAVERFLATRRLLLDTMARVSDADFHHSLDGGQTAAQVMEMRYVKINDQVAEIVRWRMGQQARPAAGPGILVLAALRAARKELLTTIALIPERSRSKYVLADGAMLRDYLIRITTGDRDLLIANRIDSSDPSVHLGRDAGWPAVWRDLHVTRQRLQALLGTLREEDLRRDGQVYRQVCQRVEADRALTAALRSSPDVAAPLRLHWPVT